MTLVKRLSLPEAVGLSLSMICPSVTAAFNVSLVAGATGPAAPLAFAIATLAMTLIALSFTAFAHRVAHAGSAYAYIAHTFGHRAGFVAGCALLLTYVAFAAGVAALVGSFMAAGFAALGIPIGAGWMVISVAGMLLAGWLAYRDMRLAGRLMLALEAVVVLAILALGMRVLLQAAPSAGEIAASFTPAASLHGWSGIGVGMVFSILSFAGFEGAATLGEETLNPRRNIPIALLGTVLISGLFFVFIALCEVVGFGVAGSAELARSQAPLNDLALRYATPAMAVALDFAAAASCFAAVLGSLAAAARLLFAIGRGGLAPSLAKVHPLHGTPSTALAVVTALMLACFFGWAPFAGAGDFYGYVSAIGVMSLIVVYVGVAAAEMREAGRERRLAWLTLCATGPLILLWVLYRNLVPVPAYPSNLWPYVALAWVCVAWAVTWLRPRVMQAPA